MLQELEDGGGIQPTTQVSFTYCHVFVKKFSLQPQKKRKSLKNEHSFIFLLKNSLHNPKKNENHSRMNIFFTSMLFIQGSKDRYYGLFLGYIRSEREDETTEIVDISDEELGNYFKMYFFTMQVRRKIKNADGTWEVKEDWPKPKQQQL